MSEAPEMKHAEFALRVYESEVPGMLEMSVNFPEDMDENNLRPCEQAGIIILQFIEERAETFNAVKDH